MNRFALPLGIAALMAIVSAPKAASAQDATSADRIVTTAAGERYRAGVLHRWILGRHYRDLWTEPVQVELLDLVGTAGGLTPTGTGGGMQTRSLRFLGADGREYAFRSVDKDPSAVLDSILRETIVSDLVQDGISAAHPFGALVAAPLLDAVGLLNVDPQLRVMPDDPALGEYREEFAGMLGLMEERPDENDGARTSFRGTERVIASERLTERLDDGPTDRVDAREFLKARLMDVFLGDWDRHRGQWRWATYDDETPRVWLPVPRDRDQAFSKFDGLATRIVSLYMPQFVRFEEGYPSITRLHWNARALDRWLLAELDREAWDSVGTAVQSALTDAVIEEAVLRLPPEIRALNGAELDRTLKARRDKLPEAWDEFYRLVSDRVDVQGTNEAEVVRVDRSQDGAVHVTVTAPSDSDGPYFSRRFLAGETNEVRVYLKGGDDEVTVTGSSDSAILVRLMGGRGDDVFTFPDEGDHVRLYDSQGVNSARGANAPDIDDKEWEEWEWSEDDRDQPRDWGKQTLPIFWSSYSTDLGFFVGGGASFKGFGFRKRPFSWRLDARGGWSPRQQKGRVELDGRFNRQNSPIFWPFSARVSRLDVVHFYGLGNESTSGGQDFHEVDLTMATASLGLGMSFESGVELSGGVRVERASTQENAGSYFDTVRPVYGEGGFTSLALVSDLVFDPLANSVTTGSRLRVRASGAFFPGVVDVEDSFGRIGAEVSGLLASSPWPAVALAVRAGAEQVRGRFPWHKAAFLGGVATVRGYDEQRFAGDVAVYASAEGRLRLLRPRVIVPVAIGVFGFVDTGRVYLDNDSPGGWHTGVGGGVYFQPIQQPFLVRIGAGQGEEATKVFLALGLPY
jgi:hypothetical protein